MKNVVNSFSVKGNIISSIIFVVLIVLLYIYKIPANISVEVIYNTNADSDLRTWMYFDKGEGFNQGDCLFSTLAEGSGDKSYAKGFAEFDIPEKYSDVKSFRIDLEWEQQEIAISCITIKNHGVTITKLTPQIIKDNFIFTNVREAVVEGTYLYIIPSGEDPYLVANGNILEQYRSAFQRQKYLKINLVIYILLLAIVIGNIYTNRIYILKLVRNKYTWICNNKEKIDKALDKAIIISIIVSMLLVLYMALFSRLYAHPDENLTKSAIDYYMARWFTPNLKSDLVVDSFSVYGNTRLREYTFYYLLAGKIGFAANLLNIKNYYRMFNVILFTILSVIVLRHRKDMPYLSLGICMTPQIWYIFSYATSDGWDYFLSFLIMFELMKEEGIINRVLKADSLRSELIKFVITIVLFSNIFWAKKSYYIILIAAFCIIVTKWLRIDKSEKKKYFIRCVQILLCTLIIVTVRQNVKWLSNNGDELIAKQLQTETAEYLQERKGQIINPIMGIKMKEQGVTLKEIFSKYKFAQTLYKSFFGTYGWMEYYSGVVYYLLIGIANILLLIIGISALKNERKNVTCMLWTNGLVVFSAALILWNSWTNDYQVQGRYMVCVALSGLWYWNNFRYDNQMMKRIKGIILCLYLLCTVSFTVYGITNLL